MWLRRRRASQYEFRESGKEGVALWKRVPPFSTMVLRIVSARSWPWMLLYLSCCVAKRTLSLVSFDSHLRDAFQTGFGVVITHLLADSPRSLGGSVIGEACQGQRKRTKRVAAVRPCRAGQQPRQGTSLRTRYVAAS